MANRVVRNCSDQLELLHAGRKGMKWGVRRFQKKDGHRTPEGKKQDLSRHGKTLEKPKAEDYVKSQQAKKKGPEGLSNEQLKKLNERLQLEDTYKKLTTEKLDNSKNWIKEALIKSGKDTFADISKGLLTGSAKLLIQQLSPQLANAAGYTGKK